MRARVVATAMVVMLNGCATVLYDGPRRPSDEVSRIDIAAGTTVYGIDGEPGRGRSRFEVLPGIRSLALVAAASEPRAVCFRARAGHRYVALLEGESLRVAIRDETDDRQIPARRMDSVSEPCPDPSRPGIAESRDDATTSPTDASYESPDAPDAKAAVRARAAKARLPGTGVSLELGWSFGGDDLVVREANWNTDTGVRAGDGNTLAVSGQWTPLWLGRSVGLGVYGSLGLKYGGGGSGLLDSRLRRVPLIGQAQALVRMGRIVFALLRAGIEKDLLVEYTGDVKGAQKGFDSSIGPVVDLGIHLSPFRLVGFTATARYTSVEYSQTGVSVSAASWGMSVAMHAPL